MIALKQPMCTEVSLRVVKALDEKRRCESMTLGLTRVWTDIKSMILGEEEMDEKEK